MSKEKIINGYVWYISDAKSSLINDIDTDQIYHNAHLAITDLAEMGKYAFGNLDGWRDFSKKVQAGDILIVGENFGSGSSRQQAVDCFRSLGISTIVGASFGAIFKRNAINSGFPLVTCPEVGSSGLKNGDKIEVNFKTGIIRGLENCDINLKAQPFSDVQMEIYQAGHLFSYGKKMEGIE
jgi:3-isopropylmalate/(R)-2-methylmalate dehydratase small subunit